MRISDWSSDVCSSDLLFLHAIRLQCAKHGGIEFVENGDRHAGRCHHALPGAKVKIFDDGFADCRQIRQYSHPRRRRHGQCPHTLGFYKRSEEHTSELQSLMRISYAVFCLKKKNKQTTTN